MKLIHSAIFIIAVFMVSAMPMFAQESNEVVVDEVVAQINDGVITLSQIKREMKNAIESLVREGKTREAAQAEIESKKAELIVSLINEELILQKGKEIGVDGDVETQINQEFVRLMKEGNLKTLDALYKEMEKAGVRPDELRAAWRKRFTQEAVLGREVDGKIYWSRSAKELKEYFEKNKAKFTKPETVSLSELFLGFAGRNQKTVEQKADQLLTQLKGGADFIKLAMENSDRPDVQKNQGKVGTFSIEELNEKVATAIKGLKTGQYAKMEIEEGIEILRVDERSDPGTEAVFDENRVRNALTFELRPQERKKYVVELRKDAFVKVAESYRAIIEPLLQKDDGVAAAAKNN